MGRAPGQGTGARPYCAWRAGFPSTEFRPQKEHRGEASTRRPWLRRLGVRTKHGLSARQHDDVSAPSKTDRPVLRVQSGVLIGLLLALACAASASLGGLWKQKGAVESEAVDIRHPIRSASALFRSRWFTLGWIVAVLAWLLHVGALALAPLSLAQAVISGGIVLLGILAERFFDLDVTRRQWIGLTLLGLGLAVLGITAHGDSNHSTYGIVALIAFEL